LGTIEEPSGSVHVDVKNKYLVLTRANSVKSAF